MVVDSSVMLINGLRTEATKTYRDVLNRQSDGRLAMVMDLDGFTATNRQHDLGYREAAPHVDQWVRGDAIPTEGMASKTFNVVVHNWGKRLEWHQDDREDDQTQTLMQDAAAVGRDAGLLAERMFFDILKGTSPTTLPTIPNAADGSALFVTTARFGSSLGNTVTGFTVGSAAEVVSGYFNALVRLTDFDDGKGQPLWTPDVIDKGVVVICSNADEKVWREGLEQKIQGAPATIAAGVSNIIIDASRNVTLWPTQRVATGESYVILKETPVKPVFVVNRRGMRALDSLADMNNSDRVRTTGMEYVQWDLRMGAGVNLPYGAIHLT